MNLEKEIHHLIDLAIKEDISKGDITTESCIDSEEMTSGKFILKQAGIVAGLPFLDILFKKIDSRTNLTLFIPEGSYQKAGTIIATISGPVRAILAGERIALNLIQHASGVASITAAYVKKVSGLCAIMDTRKTLPGLRALEKYAVKIGGGKNHRFGLNDRCIIKSHHLSFVSSKVPHPILYAYNCIKSQHPQQDIEIEVEEMSQLEEALQTDAVAIMLKDMTPEEARKSVEKIRKTNKKVYIESAGAITLDTVRAYAEVGVDGISLGALTHSVQALDIGMRLQ